MTASPLIQLVDWLIGVQNELDEREPTLDRIAECVDTCTRIGPDLKSMGLHTTSKQADRIIKYQAEINPIDRHLLSTMFGDLVNRMQDELESMDIILLDASEVELYEESLKLFSPASEAFGSACDDIEEAARCLALQRGTACVFHLMRVMEIGLRALGKALTNPDLDPGRNPTWETILKKCDDELKKPLADRSAEWRIDGQFFAESTANLRAVKDAWRNPTLHVERSYDNERAREVWNAVRAFMRHLATKLHNS
jgi:hypothetical protein